MRTKETLGNTSVHHSDDNGVYWGVIENIKLPLSFSENNPF